MSIPQDLAPHIVAVLDLDEPGWETAWRALQEWAAGAGLGGVLLRRGHPEAWVRIAEESRALGSSRPLFMADFEQGAASQLPGYAWLPKPLTVGATRSPLRARQVGARVADQAAALGIDVVLAPVADLLFRWTSAAIGGRSFGATPGAVGEMVDAFVQGCQEGGVRAVAKHFPGHGRAHADSHRCLPTIAVDLQTWAVSDAVPFVRACGAGVFGVMVGHLRWRGTGGAGVLPASRDPAVVRVLREEVGFRGMVLTDSLEMAGAGGRGQHIAREALSSGVDLVLGMDLGLPSGPTGAVARAPRASEDTPLDPLARTIAEEAVAWITTPSSLPRRCRAIALHVAPDRTGGREWATPLVEALRHRTSFDRAGARVVAVSASTPARSISRYLARSRGGPEPPVLLLCGAVRLALATPPWVPCVFVGDATRASQEAVVRLLFEEIPWKGTPDLPPRGSPRGTSVEPA